MQSGNFVFGVGARSGGWLMDYKERIIELVNDIESIGLLQYIYKFIEKAVTVWK